MFDWGCHAVDYMRFMTGLDITHAHAFYNHAPQWNTPTAAQFSFRFESGATMSASFVSAGGSSETHRSHLAWFTIWFEGGCLTINGFESIDVDGKRIYEYSDSEHNGGPLDGYVEGVGHDPWFEQDKVFIEAVRANDGSTILNDYGDGMKSLAPVLAGWLSARLDGKLIRCEDVAVLAQEQQRIPTTRSGDPQPGPTAKVSKFSPTAKEPTPA